MGNFLSSSRSVFETGHHGINKGSVVRGHYVAVPHQPLEWNDQHVTLAEGKIGIIVGSKAIHDGERHGLTVAFANGDGCEFLQMLDEWLQPVEESDETKPVVAMFVEMVRNELTNAFQKHVSHRTSPVGLVGERVMIKKPLVESEYLPRAWCMGNELIGKTGLIMHAAAECSNSNSKTATVVFFAAPLFTIIPICDDNLRRVDRAPNASEQPYIAHIQAAFENECHKAKAAAKDIIEKTQKTLRVVGRTPVRAASARSEPYST